MNQDEASQISEQLQIIADELGDHLFELDRDIQKMVKRRKKE